MTTMKLWAKRLFVGLATFVLVACETPETVTQAVEPLGDFKLGFTVVVAKNAEKGPFSRDATTEELEAALKPEIERVFGVYQGERTYHIGLSVDAYALAVPGIPIVASPKSALVVTLNVWDDQKQSKVTEEHKRFTVLEAITPKTLFGSGLTQTKEEQLAALSRLAVQQMHEWLRENEAVFKPDAIAQTDS